MLTKRQWGGHTPDEGAIYNCTFAWQMVSETSINVGEAQALNQ